MAKALPGGWCSVSTLGEGSQAHVHLVCRNGENDKYVMKLLRKGRPAAAYARFSREIATIKSLDHRGIVRIHEHSSPDDSDQYYVMDHVEGARSLRQLVQRDGNPFRGEPLKVLDMFQQLLEAIQHYHQQGIVHRDLSPANVLVLPNGAIKIIDFGLCQRADHDTITLTDENVGTPNYMAPECESYSDKEPTIQADLYSAGKILWTAITGRLAFARERPVFNQLSMPQLFPDDQTAWHLQLIFERTVRHAIDSRWRTPSEGLKDAHRVRRLVTTNCMPIEAIADGHCHICGIGKLLEPSDVIDVGGYLLFSQENPGGTARRVCNYCGHCSLWYTTRMAETLANRKNLD